MFLKNYLSTTTIQKYEPGIRLLSWKCKKRRFQSLQITKLLELIHEIAVILLR